ncbi:hypothetical protein VN12_10600 [Pirellula sp. SH-Sr6A]|uniref:TubC N-terminal docking domain-related protein n=1 Tax=Pirellula sp. SH-Sr6A TaxID=1632865 RepID=UPI00078BC91B|nr:hypothetical protein [Pirellula sp. SH-Sr6A]AMV32565.1 hypothetical protein VN12_10600 [Pirellula sp. SH-Sr6A]
MMLIERLRALGVELTIEGDGLAFDAPEGVLSAELIEEMKAYRSELIAAIEHRDAPGMDPIGGVFCPFCRGDRFEDVYMGWRCVRCDRLAWWWLGESLVRFDVGDLKL